MSMQAGIWHFDRRPVSPTQLAAFESQLILQGPDSRGEYEEQGFAMLYRSFYITEEDSLELQPIRGSSNSALTWDGRLDNRDELLASLDRVASDLHTDADIVNAALVAWGEKALPRFIGDWALAWWNPHDRRLLLARDYIGKRKLYYLCTDNTFYWSTDLSALVLHSGQRYTLCDAYFAGYLSSQPDPNLTPYDEIQSVPAGGYLEVTPGKVRVRRYWSFNALPDIRYKRDSEYEVHFRHLLRQSVKRYLRTTYPILADLSGGLDSSAIVCMAYDILKAGEAKATINTFSMYSLEESGGDERPYFIAVEEHIGKAGTHMEVRSKGSRLLQPVRQPHFSAIPGYFDRTVEAEQQLMAQTATQGNRLHFSGLGGDELLGGVQDPVPILAQHLWHLRLPTFWQQLAAWALKRKTTLWSLLRQSTVALAPLWLRTRLDEDKANKPPEWLQVEFIREQRIARRRLERRWIDWLPGPPEPDSGYRILAGVLGGHQPHFTYAEQSALPYFDRDLVQFLFAIPRDQVLRPHQRRSLMRRALSGIVPDAVLSRKTKWIGHRDPALEILESATTLNNFLRDSPIAKRYTVRLEVESGLVKLREGKEVPLLLLERLTAACFLYASLERKRLWQFPMNERPSRLMESGSESFDSDNSSLLHPSF